MLVLYVLGLFAFQCGRYRVLCFCRLHWVFAAGKLRSVMISTPFHPLARLTSKLLKFTPPSWSLAEQVAMARGFCRLSCMGPLVGDSG